MPGSDTPSAGVTPGQFPHPGGGVEVISSGASSTVESRGGGLAPFLSCSSVSPPPCSHPHSLVPWKTGKVSAEALFQRCPRGRAELQARARQDREGRERKGSNQPGTPRCPGPGLRASPTCCCGARDGSCWVQLCSAGSGRRGWGVAVRAAGVGRARAGAALGAGRPGRRVGEERQALPSAAGWVAPSSPSSRATPRFTSQEGTKPSAFPWRKLRPGARRGDLKRPSVGEETQGSS